MEHTAQLKPVAPGSCETDQKYYTVAQVANRYGVSSRVIYEALNAGKIRGIRIGGWRISEEALREFEASGGMERERTVKIVTPVAPKARRRTRRPIVTKIAL